MCDRLKTGSLYGFMVVVDNVRHQPETYAAQSLQDKSTHQGRRIKHIRRSTHQRLLQRLQVEPSHPWFRQRQPLSNSCRAAFVAEETPASSQGECVRSSSFVHPALRGSPSPSVEPPASKSWLSNSHSPARVAPPRFLSLTCSAGTGPCARD